MPELPEVETVKNELLPHIIGRKIRDVEILLDNVVFRPSVEEFRTGLIGQAVTGAKRRGKYLILELTSGQYLIIHLRMTGALLINSVSCDLIKHIRAVFYFEDGTKLYFRDPRRMGRMWLVDDYKTVVSKLGPEPLEPDFTAEVLAERLKKRSVPIKAVLLEQDVIAGIGNMYADEILFMTKIHPMRLTKSLTPEEINKIYHAIQEVLRAGIRSKGASIESYYRPSGELGSAHYDFKVAHRRGKTCPLCGGKIERLEIRGRGSYFCPLCQPLNPPTGRGTGRKTNKSKAK